MTDDIKQMGSLLSRMTESNKEQIKFNENQVSALIEILVPKMVMDLPGMPAGMQCKVTRDFSGWTVRIDRPQ